MIVLNVGGGPTRSVPAEFDGWEQHLLDIDSKVQPDICCDIKDMPTLYPGKMGRYDAVYSSHTLEHVYKHEVPQVLGAMLQALKPGGKCVVIVPDIKGMMRRMLADNLDLNDTWYRTGQGAAITFHDVLYGWDAAMRNGNLYYAHKCGFSYNGLGDAFVSAGFTNIQVQSTGADLLAIGVKDGEFCNHARQE